MASTPQVESRAKLSLPSLPPEVRRIILSHLEDCSTLRQAILSHSCFNGVFAENKDFIIKGIVTSHVSPELLPVALSVLESSRIEPWTREKALDLLDRHSSAYVCPPFQLTIRDALWLEKMHSHVRFFAQGFAASALSKHPLTVEVTESPSAVSADEWHRIEHNFYLFEFYAQIFRERDEDYNIFSRISTDFDVDELRELKKKRHSFWEIEQQTCVYEYLFRELSKVYNEIALHDVSWESELDFYADVEAWEGDGFNLHKAYFLLCGLAWIRTFVTVDNFEEGSQLIHEMPVKGPFQKHINLEWQLYNPNDDGAMLKEYTPERAKLVIGPSFLPHLDHGPAEAWKWVFASTKLADFGYNLQTRNLRARGYVMWDYVRLLDWGFFQSEWVPPEEDDGQGYRDRWRAMEKAQARKMHLYRLGASGWWSEDDESQLEWVHLPGCDL